MYTYSAKLVRVIDGDTVELQIDLGFNAAITEHFRLAGIDSPEKRGLTKEEGLKAKKALEDLLSKSNILTVNTRKGSKKQTFGRWLAVLHLTTEEHPDLNVNQWLIDNGYAIPYMVETL